MTRFVPTAFLALALALGLPAFAASDGPPTDASLKELIDLAHAARMLESMKTQVDAMMTKSMRDALAGRPVTVEQQKIIDDMQAQIVALVGEELQWDKFEPVMLDVYRQSFSQREVDGMIAFYKTDAGRAVIDKMPVVMQNTIQRMQSMMKEITPRLQKIQHDAFEKLAATRTAPGADAPK